MGDRRPGVARGRRPGVAPQAVPDVDTDDEVRALLATAALRPEVELRRALERWFVVLWRLRLGATTLTVWICGGGDRLAVPEPVDRRRSPADR